MLDMLVSASIAYIFHILKAPSPIIGISINVRICLIIIWQYIILDAISSLGENKFEG